jgi:hypothetical protein
MLEEIEKQGEKMLALLEDLLSLARVGRIETPTEAVDVTVVVQQVLDDLSETIARDGIAVTLNELPPLKVPETLLAQLFSNLIGNALRYAGGAGARIEVGGESSDGLILYYVSDHGPGIPLRNARSSSILLMRNHGENDWDRIGLATRKIVRLYDGRIRVEETPGRHFHGRIPFGRRIKSGWLIPFSRTLSGGLAESFQPHPLENVLRLANWMPYRTTRTWFPRIESRSGSGRSRRQRPAHRFPVVDHQTEVASPIGRLGSSRREVDELVAQVDEGHAIVPAAQLELEQRSVEFQGGLHVVDLQGHMVDPHRPGLRFCFHANLLCVANEKSAGRTLRSSLSNLELSDLSPESVSCPLPPCRSGRA